MPLSSFTQPPTKQEVETALRTLERSTSRVDEKRLAFSIVQQAHVPVINRTKEYASELSRVFALRFARWPKPPPTLPLAGSSPTILDISNHSGQCKKHALANRIRGLVFGAALGDAVGLSTEFLTRSQVQEYYPTNHVFHPQAVVHPDFHRINFPAGDWTDDTDQLLLILQTLLENNGHYDGPCFAKKIVDWKNHGFPGLGDQNGAGLGRTTLNVLNHKEFTANPHLAAQDIWERGGKKMAANGAVMRTAITGVAYFWEADVVTENTINFCKATHADPRCVASCLVVSECVRVLLLQVASQDLGSSTHGSTLSVDDIIDSAVARAIENVPDLDQETVAGLRLHSSAESLEELQLDEQGKIGYTFKGMGCGIWALRQAADLTKDNKLDIAPTDVVQKILQQIARAGGDADTNGTVACALMGVLLGYDALPWTNELPYGGWLEAWIQKLLFMCCLPVTPTRGKKSDSY